MREAVIVIATTQHSLLVYKYFKMVWAAHTDTRPVAIYRLDYKGIEGHLLLLAEERLLISALGTHASPP
jgi:hypothetical protein